MKVNKKKNLILNEGFALMRTKGFRATSVDEIVLNLGIPKGSFYYYFKSKGDFTIEVLIQYSATVYGRMEKHLKNDEITPVARLIGLYSEYIDQYVNSSTIGYGNFATKILEEAGDEYPEIRKAANNIFDYIKDLHVHCIEEARQGCEIRKDIEPDKLAEFIIYAWEGALRRMRAIGNVKPLVVFREMLRNCLLR
jgi:TetR/AcrR family transcriptional regulator, transcriptional repressor for nem operon